MTQIDRIYIILASHIHLNTSPKHVVEQMVRFAGIMRPLEGEGFDAFIFLGFGPLPRNFIILVRMWGNLFLVILVLSRIDDIVDAALPTLALPTVSPVPDINVTHDQDGTVQASLRYVHYFYCKIVEWKPTCSPQVPQREEYSPRLRIMAIAVLRLLTVLP